MEKATAFAAVQASRGLRRHFHPHCSPREKRNETGCPTLLRCWNLLGMKYPNASIQAVNPALFRIVRFHEQRLNLEQHHASGGQDVDRES